MVSLLVARGPVAAGRLLGRVLRSLGRYHPTGKPVLNREPGADFCVPAAHGERRSFLRRQDSLRRRASGFPSASEREGSGSAYGLFQRRTRKLPALSRAESRTALLRSSPAPSFCIGPSRRRWASRREPIIGISDLELASRLSFFLWSTVPDDELLKVAEQGKLKDPKVFEQQVRRMLASEKSRALVTNFASEWLKLRDIDTIDPDPFIYPNFDPSLRTAFRRELELFMDSIQHEDRSVLDFLTANYTFVNERLALHYGIPNVRGEEFRRVSLPDSTRYGLLGKGAVLMVTSYANRTSVVLRGNYILENILGTPPSPPPPNVPAFKENKEGEKPHTVRETMEMHRANPTCNGCHGIIDPLGFALENFDTVGAWRSKDRYTRTVIDASGKLIDGTVSQRTRRPSQGADVASQRVRRNHDRKVFDVCARAGFELPPICRRSARLCVTPRAIITGFRQS